MAGRSKHRKHGRKRRNWKRGRRRNGTYVVEPINPGAVPMGTALRPNPRKPSMSARKRVDALVDAGKYGEAMKLMKRIRAGKKAALTRRKRNPKRGAGPYAKFVKKHIGKYLGRGMSAPDAMRAVAGDWRAKKARANPYAGARAGKHRRPRLSKRRRNSATPRRVVTVARAGTKMASFKRGGHRFSKPVWTAAIYEARKRKRDGAVTWRLAERFGREVSGNTPSGRFLREVQEAAAELGLPFVEGIKYGQRANPRGGRRRKRRRHGRR